MNAQTIIVGVSGTTAAHPAVDWAVHYAARNHGEVLLEHTVDLSWGAAAPSYAEAALLEAEEQLRAEAARAQELEPRVPVRSTVRVGEAMHELTAAADGAQLLVVGSERLNDEADHAVSRRAARIAAAASSSVVVIPSEASPSGTGIVVGVDGSADSAAAVKFAAREADFFGEQLTVVYSWYAPEPWMGSTAASIWPTEPGEEDRMVLAEAIAGLAEDYPDLTVVTDLVVSDPVTALDRAGRTARMVVVGSRGRHGLAKLVLGSVSEQIVWTLPCAVAVIKPRD